MSARCKIPKLLKLVVKGIDKVGQFNVLLLFYIDFGGVTKVPKKYIYWNCAKQKKRGTCTG